MKIVIRPKYFLLIIFMFAGEKFPCQMVLIGIFEKVVFLSDKMNCLDLAKLMTATVTLKRKNIGPVSL